MDELSATLFDRLVKKTFESMSKEERLAFVERLFADMPQESQERILQRMLRTLNQEDQESDVEFHDHRSRRHGPPFMRWAMGEHSPRDIGPWRMCRRMMVQIDRASQLRDLDAAHPAQVFGALGDETRINIIKLLSEGERSVEELTQILDAAQSTISHHLRVLKDAGLVQADKRGRMIFYSISKMEE
jgi:DNA-binding transcriptional ArsR family regulator